MQVRFLLWQLMEWIAIVIGVLMYSFSAYITYHQGVRESSWYLPLFGLVSVLTGLCFAITCRLLGDKARMYMFSFWWDTILTLTYYLIPVIFFSVRFGRTAALGMGFVVVGLAILKMAGD